MNMNLDARGIPTCKCPNCGGEYFIIIVKFDSETYTISEYKLEAQCNDCSTFITSPMPENKPNYRIGN